MRSIVRRRLRRENSEVEAIGVTNLKPSEKWTFYGLTAANFLSVMIVGSIALNQMKSEMHSTLSVIAYMGGLFVICLAALSLYIAVREIKDLKTIDLTNDSPYLMLTFTIFELLAFNAAVAEVAFHFLKI